VNESLGFLDIRKLGNLVTYPPGIDTVGRLWERSMDMKYVMRGEPFFSVVNGLNRYDPGTGRSVCTVHIFAFRKFVVSSLPPSVVEDC
jgi:hypothetical protein